MQPDTPSPLDTLRQLQAMREAGTLTEQEFDALKQRLIFGAAPVAAPGEVPAAPPSPALPYLDSGSALAPEASPLLAPEPDWQAAPALPAAAYPAGPADYEPEPEPAAERRNPLNLVFALGGLLLFLGVMAYLGFQRRPDEHVGSTTLTASDTTQVAAPEGPQAEQITLPPAVPETLRVAPTTPPPAAALPAATDSTAALPETLPTPAATTPAPAKPTTAKPAAATKPAATPTVADSVAGQ